MVKTLLKKQFAEIFRSYFFDAKKNPVARNEWRENFLSERFYARSM